MYRVILLRLLRARFGELRKPSNSYKIDSTAKWEYVDV